MLLNIINFGIKYIFELDDLEFIYTFNTASLADCCQQLETNEFQLPSEQG